ncbi:MAG: transglycosylase SLT domain-containing protein [Betaproteobacteria bacterium]|nr:transglycosylase SLT domain-containing protein [Betaproteobacteria bacterium]
MRAPLRSLRVAAWLLLAAASSAARADGALAALEFEAARGDPAAQTELAVLYEHAEGLAKDPQRAAALYCQAARQGYADAQFKLGWMYANGRGLPRDDGIAVLLFQKAAALGHPDAAKLLAYVRPRPDAEMPPCLAPDPVLVAVPDAPAPEVPMPVVVPADRVLPIAAVENPAPVLVVPDAPPTLAAAPRRMPIALLVNRIAPLYAVDPELALAMIAVESDFDPAAVSPRNAQGLMQLIPETARRFGVKRVFDPVDNIKGGLAYIRWLLAFFQGNVQLVIAAYNAGEGAVEKYRGIPPYAETRRYVQKITGMYPKAMHPYEERIAAPSALVARAKR